jgi:hypothetical protein
MAVLVDPFIHKPENIHVSHSWPVKKGLAHIEIELGKFVEIAIILPTANSASEVKLCHHLPSDVTVVD